MAESILNHKRLLIVDDEIDVLTTLEEEIMHESPNCIIDKATNYDQAAQLLQSENYDIVVLDIMGVRGFDLLKITVARNFKTTMLTSKVLTPEALKESHDLGARAYLPKDKLGEIVPFLEDILKYDHKSGWKRLVEKLGDYFDDNFEPEWRRKAGIYYWY